MPDKPSDSSESRLKMRTSTNSRSEPFFCALFSQAGSRLTIAAIQSRGRKQTRSFALQS